MYALCSHLATRQHMIENIELLEPSSKYVLQNHPQSYPLQQRIKFHHPAACAGIRLWKLEMKKKPPAPIRADDAMARFDHLLAAMAPKMETKRAATKPRKTRGPKPRRRIT